MILEIKKMMMIKRLRAKTRRSFFNDCGLKVSIAGFFE